MSSVGKPSLLSTYCYLLRFVMASEDYQNHGYFTSLLREQSCCNDILYPLEDSFVRLPSNFNLVRSYSSLPSPHRFTRVFTNNYQRDLNISGIIILLS